MGERGGETEPEVRAARRDDGSTDWRHARTARLHLDLAVEADVDDLFAIHADPATWRHYPSGRHTDRAASAAMVGEGERQVATHGLGYWSVRERPGGPVVGRGGCAVPALDPASPLVTQPDRLDEPVFLPWWNLYYRLSPAVHRRGYATELARASLAAARSVAPQRPVLAFLLAHNHGSHRTALAVGLREVWRGPDHGNPDPRAVRLVLLDREPSPEWVETLRLEMRAG